LFEVAAVGRLKDRSLGKNISQPRLGYRVTIRGARPV
jgi:hypothetical protein